MKRGFLFLAIVLAGCGKGPSEDQCKKLLDHLVDLEFKKAGAGAAADAAKADLAKQKASVIEAKSPEFISTCVERTARDRVECALAATDLEGVAKCDDAK
ncbi:MAG: hypothetical protein ACTHU0_22220 [Kofleriaceae bacterium]